MGANAVKYCEGPPPMAAKHRVYLVPGFFGFANLGDLAYFGHVRSFLTQALAAEAIDVELHVVKTPPTASLPKRATRLLEAIAETAGGDDGPLHLIGHSSGGLDVRLLVAPGTSLPTAFGTQPYAQRVRSVITVSTPHHGTPVASFFTSLLGQKLLQVLSLATIYVLRVGGFPLSVLVKLAGVFGRLDEGAPLNSSVLDEVNAELLGDFTADRRRALAEFLTDVERDQALMLQLTPAGVDVFNASAQPRPGVRYGCVVTRARSPGLASRLSAGLSPSAHATHTVYDALYRIAAQMPPDKVPPLTEDWKGRLLDAFGELPTPADNDGVVPTLSQLHGELVACASADHLDAIGHFDDPTHVPPHFDWLTTGTGFQRREFEEVWTAVARFIAGSR